MVHNKNDYEQLINVINAMHYDEELVIRKRDFQTTRETIYMKPGNKVLMVVVRNQDTFMVPPGMEHRHTINQLVFNPASDIAKLQDAHIATVFNHVANKLRKMVDKDELPPPTAAVSYEQLIKVIVAMPDKEELVFRKRQAASGKILVECALRNQDVFYMTDDICLRWQFYKFGYVEDKGIDGGYFHDMFYGFNMRLQQEDSNDQAED